MREYDCRQKAGNYVITRTGTELLTPGLPYTAEEIEAVMRGPGSEVAGDSL